MVQPRKGARSGAGNMSELGGVNFGKFVSMIWHAKALIALNEGTKTTMACTHCGSDFPITVCLSNGHAHGACSGENCDLSFIE